MTVTVILTLTVTLTMTMTMTMTMTLTVTMTLTLTMSMILTMTVTNFSLSSQQPLYSWLHAWGLILSISPHTCSLLTSFRSIKPLPAGLRQQADRSISAIMKRHQTATHLYLPLMYARTHPGLFVENSQFDI